MMAAAAAALILSNHEARRNWPLKGR